MPQAQNVGGQLDYSVLDPLMNPEPMQFTPVPGGQANMQASAPADQMQQAILRYQGMIS
jgi:hypothetical protein